MRTDNPFESPSSALSAPGVSEELGDLAQSSRKNELGQAKGGLIVIGLLTIGVNTFMFANADSEVSALNVPNPSELVAVVRVIYGAAILLGLAILVCGCLVKSWPVPMTVTGLVLYLLGSIGFAILDPSSLVRGIIFKVIVIVMLVKSVKTAIEYERDRRVGLS